MDENNLLEKQNGARTFIVIIAAAVFSVLLLIYSKEVSQAVIRTIGSCLTVIIPSLFGFMVVSNIIIKSNIYIWLSKPFYLISKYVMRLPPELFSVFLLANLGGYPVGGKLIRDLLDSGRISKKDAECLMCSSFCSGPAFLIGAVGIKLFLNVTAGLIVYLSIVCSNLIIAFFKGLKRSIPNGQLLHDAKVNLNSKIIVDSIESTIKVLAMICGMLIFFSVITEVLFVSGIISRISELVCLLGATSDNANAIVKSVIEISTVGSFQQNSYSYLPIIAALSSFGGACVLTQLSSIIGSKINMKQFILTRPLQILISGVIAYLFTKLFSANITVMTACIPSTTERKDSVIPSIVLIIMIILLLMKNNTRFLKKGVI